MSVNVEASFVYLVYPFVFDAGRFLDRVAAIENAESPGRNRALRIWREDRFPEDDLLSQVANYLNPADARIPTARLWRLDATQQDAYGVCGKADWCLVHPKQASSFRVGPKQGSGFAGQLALFQDGVGFLTLRADPDTSELNVWLNYLHYSRFVRGQRKVHIELRQRVMDAETQISSARPFFPEGAGGVASHPDGSGQLAEILAALLMTGSFASESRPWWREIFVPGQVIPFAALFVEEVSKDGVPELLYRLRSFFHADQEIHPTHEDLQTNNPFLLPYAEGQWFIFSLEGGAFLAFDAPDTTFFRKTLPQHLQASYFLLFLLALHQRFALMSLSQEVAEHWLGCRDNQFQPSREAVFRRIRDSLLSFTARAHFFQVMQREHHHRCYRKWLEVFQIADMFQEVRSEVQDMHDFLAIQQAEERLSLEREEQKHLEEQAKLEAARERAAERRASNLEQLLTGIAAVLGIPTIALTFIQAIGGTDFTSAIAVTLASMAVGAFLYVGIRRFVNQGK